jgi:hydroxymethylbilane synthase
VTRLRLGTRESRLALVQAEWIETELRRRDPALRVEIVGITTAGDRRSEGRLAPVGGKGLFLKELEEALLAGTIDCAVHSMKDVPAALPPGLVLAGVPARADARDALVEGGGRDLGELPRGARVGTASTRRRAQLLARRPDLDVRVVRGNVQTRLRKRGEGEVDVLVLAMAGLARLGLSGLDVVTLAPETLLPAVGQGALALEHRAGDVAIAARLDAIADPVATAAVRAERGFLVALGGDCTTPLAAHATIAGGEVHLRAEVLDEEGTRMLRDEGRAPVAAAADLGRRLAEGLLARGAGALLGR